jgi:putative methyltransferase (TIGR04325 family)
VTGCYPFVVLKRIFKQIAPPFLLFISRKIKEKLLMRGGANFSHGGFKYGFDSFDTASKYVFSLGLGGYEEDLFIEKLNRAAGLVRDGKAIYERDTVIFERIEYAWELLACLLLVSQRKEHIEIVDFGGGLGTSYRQNCAMLNLAGIKTVWTVIEQTKLVRIGKSEFENDFLRFIPSLSEIDTREIDAVLFGSSLCYLEDPYEILNQTFLLGPRYIIFDRTPFMYVSDDKVAVQFVPESIYKAAFPIRTFSVSKFKHFMNQEYELIVQWDCAMQPDPSAFAMGSLWRKRIK